MRKYNWAVILFSMCLYNSILAKTTLQNNVTGIYGELLTAVQATLANKAQPLSIPEFFAVAPEEITKTLQTFGYFKPHITGRLTHTRNNWIANFFVKPGPPLLITKLNLTILGGRQQELRSAFPLQPKMIFQSNQYNAAKQALYEIAANYGYLYASFIKKVVLIDLKNYTANIDLVFNTGPCYYFGPITFNPNPFNQGFLKRFITFQPGEKYNAAKVREVQENLINSNLFEDVAITPQPTQDYQVPLAIELTPRKAKQYNLGLGYGTDTGPRGLIGLDMRHVTDTGQSFKGLIKISRIQKEIETHYLIPGHNPINSQYDISAAGQMQNLTSGTSNTLQLACGYLTAFKHWQQTLKLSIQHENYQLLKQPSSNASLLLPSINWLHSNTNDVIRPTQGHNVSLHIQGASKYLLSNADFLQSQMNLKYLTSLTDDLRLILRSSFGYTAIDNINNLPLSLQFHAGGDQSIRGYGYNDIGPGRILQTGSVELRQKIKGDWYATAFYDAGTANNKLFKNWHKGAGIGTIYHTAIGTLGLSYARALDLEHRPGRIQFSLGPEF